MKRLVCKGWGERRKARRYVNALEEEWSLIWSLKNKDKFTRHPRKEKIRGEGEKSRKGRKVIPTARIENIHTTWSPEKHLIVWGTAEHSMFLNWACGEVLRPARETGSNQSWRTSGVSSHLRKFPLEMAGRMVWRRGKNPEARLCGRVLSSGVRQIIIESKTGSEGSYDIIFSKSAHLWKQGVLLLIHVLSLMWVGDGGSWLQWVKEIREGGSGRVQARSKKGLPGARQCWEHSGQTPRHLTLWSNACGLDSNGGADSHFQDAWPIVPENKVGARSPRKKSGLQGRLCAQSSWVCCFWDTYKMSTRKSSWRFGWIKLTFQLQIETEELPLEERRWEPWKRRS